LSKARVLLVNLKSLRSETVITPLNGRFAFENLPLGDYVLIVVGSDDPYEACWKPAIREIRIKKDVPNGLRVPLLIDSERCPGAVN
jgi:hypothetical protein